MEDAAREAATGARYGHTNNIIELQSWTSPA
jgi:hypothetical protein